MQPWFKAGILLLHSILNGLGILDFDEMQCNNWQDTSSWKQWSENRKTITAEGIFSEAELQCFYWRRCARRIL